MYSDSGFSHSTLAESLSSGGAAALQKAEGLYVEEEILEAILDEASRINPAGVTDEDVLTVMRR